MTTVDPLLVAEIEVAMRIPDCVNDGCTGPAAWALIAPCTHRTLWCDVCHLDVTETIARLVEDGAPYICWGGDGEGWWAEFRWEQVR